jgi:NRAMP (natural resistance-associated macrophage protein)-like metal ion transporter
MNETTYMSTSRWVEEDALAVVGRSLSEDEQATQGTASPGHLVSPVSHQAPSTSGRSSEHDLEQVLLSAVPEHVRSRDFASNSKPWKSFLTHVGPGFLMCIAYIDPGNLEADLQTGVTTGYTLLWVLLYSTVLGGLLQSLAAKLGVSTSRHLAQHCRDMYPGPMRILLWIMAELAIVGSDIQEVVGSSLAVLLLTNGTIPLWMGVIVGAVGAYVLLFLEKFGLRWLESFFQVMVGVLALCMTVLFFVAKVPYAEVVQGLVVPKLDSGSLSTATGLLGAVIMPHNLFLHSALVHERELPIGMRSTAKHSLLYYRIEAFMALLVTLMINVSVIAVFAHGFQDSEGSESIGLYNAGTFLAGKYGNSMSVVWALGLLSAGISSTMTGTYAGQFVMSGFLEMKMGTFKRALITRAVALVPTLVVALAFDESATSLDRLNQWLNILQSVQLPFAIIPLLFLTANPGVVGLGFANSKMTNVASGTTAVVVILINIQMASQAIGIGHGGMSIAYSIFLAVVLISYVGLLGYLVLLSMRSLQMPIEERGQDAQQGLLEAGGAERQAVSDDDGGNDYQHSPDAVRPAGTFSYDPPIPIEHEQYDIRQVPESVASSRAASLVLSSRAGTVSHRVVDVTLDDD